MFKTTLLTAAMALSAATPVFASENDNSGGCPDKVDYTLPSLTLAPYVDVAVGTGGEFAVTKSEDGNVVVTHVGKAAAVNIPSLVTVGRTLELRLTQPETRYCVSSAVAVAGGVLTVKTANSAHVHFVSSVGDVAIQ